MVAPKEYCCVCSEEFVLANRPLGMYFICCNFPYCYNITVKEMLEQFEILKFKEQKYNDYVLFERSMLTMEDVTPSQLQSA